MDSYFEIKAIPDPELLQTQVVGQLMQALHSSLPAFAGRVGVSFPGYGQARTLGGIIRLHGTVQELEQLCFSLQSNPEATSYGLITEVAAVPKNLRGNLRFKRRHAKGQSHLRRLERRHKSNGTWSDALRDAITAKYCEAKHYPHVLLRSKSTGQSKFMLAVEKEVVSKPVEGEFSSYGLSKTATVPWF